MVGIVLYSSHHQGSYRSWKCMELKVHVFQAWKVPESGQGHGSHRKSCAKSWKRNTVKSFKLAALKVGDFACKIILAAFILAN